MVSSLWPRHVRTLSAFPRQCACALVHRKSRYRLTTYLIACLGGLSVPATRAHYTQWLPHKKGTRNGDVRVAEQV